MKLLGHFTCVFGEHMNVLLLDLCLGEELSDHLKKFKNLISNLSHFEIRFLYSLQ